MSLSFLFDLPIISLFSLYFSVLLDLMTEFIIQPDPLYALVLLSIVDVGCCKECVI